MRFITIKDLLIWISILSLSGLSLFVINNIAPDYFFSQFLFIIFGIVFMFILAGLDFSGLSSLFIPGYIFCIIFLSSTFFGPDIRGSTRWIPIGSFNLQPSEIIKPLLIFLYASLVVNNNGGLVKSAVIRFFIFLPIILLVLRQPDLGNAIVYTFFFGIIEVMSGLSWKKVIISVLLLFLVIPMLFFVLKDYQRSRIISFLNPELDPAGAGYNALQSIIAVGSGGIFGMGLGRGSQSSLRFLPEYHTDFIYASLVEELGFVGGLTVMIFYLILLLRLILYYLKSTDKFSSLVIIGIFAQIFCQIIINIGMNLGIMPITGITLPLLSYGGSSILSTFSGLGLAVALSRKKSRNLLVIR